MLAEKGGMSVLTLLIRSVVLFLAAVAAMRLMGKRQVGQMQPYELVVAIMIAELAATPIDGTGTPLINGLVPMAALMICHSVIAVLCMKSVRFGRFMCGRPAVLVRGGVICEEELRRNAVTLDDLMEDLRLCGAPDVGQVDTAVLETGGRMSVVLKEAFRPVCPEDLGLKPPRASLPAALILDGRVQQTELVRRGLTRSWLQRQLQALGCTPDAVLLATLDAQGILLVQRKGEGRMQVRHTDQAMGGG